MNHKLRIGVLLAFLFPLVLFGQDLLSTLGNMHSVVKGETWESVANSYGVSVLELQAANPDVKKKKLKKGTLLIIPAIPVKNGDKQQEPDGSIHATDGPGMTLVRTAIPNLKVGVLLPFSDKKMVEFYRGFLMAADSIKKTGVSLDIHAWDCGASVSQLEQLMPQLNGLDVVVGPASATQIPTVAEVCKEQGIRLVLPFWSGQSLFDYPRVYNATAPNTLFYDAAVKKLMSYYGDNNFVIVHSGNPDNHGQILSDALTRQLAQRTGKPRILEIEGSDFDYESAFNQYRNNMIVLDNSNISSLNNLLAHLKSFQQKHPVYRLSLIGYTEWQDEVSNLQNDFFALDTYIATPYYYNVLDDRTEEFERSYTKNFRSSIAQNNPRYAALGFDLGYYFLGGISSMGDTFEQMLGNIQQNPYQNSYHFERSGAGISFSNCFVQFIHFTPEKTIELIR